MFVCLFVCHWVYSPVVLVSASAMRQGRLAQSTCPPGPGVVLGKKGRKKVHLSQPITAELQALFQELEKVPLTPADAPPPQ